MGIRILIVEDEADLADFVVRGLREEGFAVEHAVDGETAWDALRFSEWDLIVLDWRLPGEDGLTVLRRFRGSGGVWPRCCSLRLETRSPTASGAWTAGRTTTSANRSHSRSSWLGSARCSVDASGSPTWRSRTAT